MDFGIDFRGTSGYVTDPANCTYCLNESYPTTRGGFTFGKNSGTFASADRDSGIDARLAGINYAEPLPSVQVVFQVDLDASGNKDIRLAIGDTSNQGANYVEILDNTTSRLILTPVAITANKWWDASGVERTSASDWVTNNVAVTLVFATTTLIIKMGGAVGYTVLAHIRITDTPAAGGGPIVGGGSLVHGSLVNGGRLVA